MTNCEQAPAWPQQAKAGPAARLDGGLKWPAIQALLLNYRVVELPT